MSPSRRLLDILLVTTLATAPARAQVSFPGSDSLYDAGRSLFEAYAPDEVKGTGMFWLGTPMRNVESSVPTYAARG